MRAVEQLERLKLTTVDAIAWDTVQAEVPYCRPRVMARSSGCKAASSMVIQLLLSAMSVGTPARCPLSTSAFLTQSCSVCGVQPILAAIDVTAAQREGCWPA